MGRWRAAGWLLATSCLGLAAPRTALAATYYLAPTGSDLGDGSFASPWFSLNYALNKYANDGVNPRVLPGDTLYLRGGVYAVPTMSDQSDGVVYICLNTQPDSPPTTIKSYPGEWAILDGGGTEVVLELNNAMHNVVFEDLEIRNGLRSGFRFGDGVGDRLVYSSTFRNLYFHDNLHPDVNTNPAGMQLSCDGCVVEQCTFENNGTTGSAHYNNANLILFNDYAKYPETDPRKSNVIRYSVFVGSGASIKDKGDFNLTDSNAPDRTNQTLGNEIHHNVFKDPLGMAMAVISDFVRLHHNLVVGGYGGFRFYTYEMTDATIWYGTGANNTFVNLTGYAIAVDDQPAIQFAGQYGHTLLNNLVYGCGTDGFIFWTGQSSRNYLLTSDFNYWHDGVATVGRRQLDAAASLVTWQGYGYDASSGRGTVQFVDATRNDYRLTATSGGVGGGQDGEDVGAFGAVNWYATAGHHVPGAPTPSAPTNLRLAN